MVIRGCNEDLSIRKGCTFAECERNPSSCRMNPETASTDSNRQAWLRVLRNGDNKATIFFVAVLVNYFAR